MYIYGVTNRSLFTVRRRQWSIDCYSAAVSILNAKLVRWPLAPSLDRSIVGTRSDERLDLSETIFKATVSLTREEEEEEEEEEGRKR